MHSHCLVCCQAVASYQTPGVEKLLPAYCKLETRASEYLNSTGMQWLLTSYSSPHPSLSGHRLVVLPHMGYVMCNGQVWSYMDPREFDRNTLSKLRSLNHTLYEEVVNKKRELLLQRRNARSRGCRRETRLKFASILWFSLSISNIDYETKCRKKKYK